MILSNHYAVKRILSPQECENIIEEGLSQLQPAATTKDRQDNKRKSEVAWLRNEEIFNKMVPHIAEGNRGAGWSFDVDWSEGTQFTKYGVGQFYNWHPDGGSDWNHIYQPAIKDEHGVWKKCDVNFTEGGYDNLTITDENAPTTDIYHDNQLQMPFTGERDWWGKVRKLSLTINLSDPKSYEGGDFEMEVRGDIEVITDGREQGSMILFPSFVPHRVTPVTRGTRYSLVIWLLGRPFR